ncbi:kinase-like domain-containing protein [Flagelloscypha sp. PMI_526]|nr:kinase-like domain-containing protein [Flagelloscypha sp. PMI_526]
MAVQDKNLEFDSIILNDLTPVIELLPNPLKHMICGGSGDIYKATYYNMGQNHLVAVKVPRIQGQQHPQEIVTNFLREVVLWSMLKHPHIVSCLGVTFQGQNKGIPTAVMPWCDHGTLANFLSQYPQFERIPFILQVGSAIQYLHSLDIAHGDIKAQNVLVTSEIPLCAVLTDFGLSRPLIGIDGFLTSHVRGTFHFMAPELLQHLVFDGLHHGRQCTKATDVWAFGMFVVQVHTSRLPLTLPPDRRTELELARLVVLEGYLPSPRDASEVPSNVWESGVLLQCWEYKVKRRIGIQDAISILKDIYDTSDAT